MNAIAKGNHTTVFNQTQIRDYERDGYVVAPALFSKAEVAGFIEHYMKLRAAGTCPGDLEEFDPENADPIKRFPRLFHMHRWDEESRKWLLDKRIGECLTGLLGAPPFAVQTMLYFKPAGARGQAMHQDQFYLHVQPGTCMAAWLALDDCDEENGCMRVVPGSQDLPVLCTELADTKTSFTDVSVPVPEGMEIRPVIMNAGDVLFFNGSLIHGSYPNTSKDRFRRSLIGHYIVGSAEKVGGFYHPVLRLDGTEAKLDMYDVAGPCGVWREIDGRPAIEMRAPTASSKVMLHE